MYSQLTEQEPYTLGVLKRQGTSIRQMARMLGRAPSTISREIERNRCHATDGAYRPSKAQERTNGRRRRSRQVRHHDPSVYLRVEELLEGQQWSPEQIACWLAVQGIARISHMTIYRHVHADARQGGVLRSCLRQGRKRRRKRTFGPERRGKLQGKPMIDTRPAVVEVRQEPVRTGLGSGAATRTSTGCCGITSPNERAWHTFSSTRAIRLPINSTHDRGSAMATRRPSNGSKNCSGCCTLGVNSPHITSFSLSPSLRLWLPSSVFGRIGPCSALGGESSS